jgi:hypothetical protein
MEWKADGSVMSLICRANEGKETRWRAMDGPLAKTHGMTALNTSCAATDTHPSPPLREGKALTF